MFAEVAGTSGEQFRRTFAENGEQALLQFLEGVGKLGQGAIPVLDELGLADQRVLRTLLALGGGYDVVEEQVNRANRAFESSNALSEEAAKRYETTASRLETVKNKAVDLAADLGEKLMPAANSVLGGVGAFLDVLDRAPEGVKTFVSAGSVLVGFLTTVSGLALLAAPGIRATAKGVVVLRGALAGLAAAGTLAGIVSVLSGPAGLIALLGGLLVVALNDLATSTKTADERMNDFEATLKDTASATDELIEKAPDLIAHLDRIRESERNAGGVARNAHMSIESLARVAGKAGVGGLQLFVEGLSLSRAETLALLSELRIMAVTGQELGAEYTTVRGVLEQWRLKLQESAAAAEGAAEAHGNLGNGVGDNSEALIAWAERLLDASARAEHVRDHVIPQLITEIDEYTRALNDVPDPEFLILPPSETPEELAERRAGMEAWFRVLGEGAPQISATGSAVDLFGTKTDDAWEASKRFMDEWRNPPTDQATDFLGGLKGGFDSLLQGLAGDGEGNLSFGNFLSNIGTGIAEGFGQLISGGIANLIRSGISALGGLVGKLLFGERDSLEKRQRQARRDLAWLGDISDETATQVGQLAFELKDNLAAQLHLVGTILQNEGIDNAHEFERAVNLMSEAVRRGILDEIDPALEVVIGRFEVMDEKGRQAWRGFIEAAREAKIESEVLDRQVRTTLTGLSESLGPILDQIERALERGLEITPQGGPGPRGPGDPTVSSGLLGARGRGNIQTAIDTIRVGIAEGLAQGFSFAEVSQMFGGDLDRLVTALDNAGMALPPDLRHLANMMQLMGERRMSRLSEELAANSQIVERMLELGLKPLESQVGNLERSLRAGLRGLPEDATSEDVMLLFGGQIRQLLELQALFGIKLDRTTISALEDKGIDVQGIIDEIDRQNITDETLRYYVNDQLIQGRHLENLFRINRNIIEMGRLLGNTLVDGGGGGDTSGGGGPDVGGGGDVEDFGGPRGARLGGRQTERLELVPQSGGRRTRADRVMADLVLNRQFEVRRAKRPRRTITR